MARVLDLCDDDVAARLKLIRDLAAIRVAAGLSGRDLGGRLGVTGGAIHHLERTTNPWVGTVQRYARSLNHVATFELRGLADPGDPAATLWRDMAAAARDHGGADTYRRAALVATLAAARRAANLLQVDVAARLGVSHVSVSQLERCGRDDHAVAMVQRYARAIGGWLHLELQPLTEGA